MMIFSTHPLVLLLGVVDLVALADVLGLPGGQHGDGPGDGAGHGLEGRRLLGGLGLLLALAKVIA